MFLKKRHELKNTKSITLKFFKCNTYNKNAYLYTHKNQTKYNVHN